MANKFDIDPDLVKKIADLLNETGLTEIEFESTGKRIRVVKATTPPHRLKRLAFQQNQQHRFQMSMRLRKSPAGRR